MPKITPVHNPNDFEVENSHNLERVVVMKEDATMNENAGKYCGLTREECREQLLENLKQSGILISIEKMVHSVCHSERTDVVVEPYLSKQWFVKMRKLANKVLENQKSSKTKVNFVPERLEKNIQRREQLLSNENYVAKAPQNIVEQERKNLETEKENLCAICAKLNI